MNNGRRLLENNETFASLDENDKHTFLSFINKKDLVHDDDDDKGRESLLDQMIDLVDREPTIKQIDVKDVFEAPFLFEPDGGGLLRAAHVLLISYGKPKTTNEENLTLHLLKKLEDKIDLGWVGVDVGIDWVPSCGWHLSDLVLLCQCHPLLIEFLIDKYISCTDENNNLLLAAILGQQTRAAKRIARHTKHAFLEAITMRSRYYGEWNVDVLSSVFEILFSKPEQDWAMQLLVFFFRNYECDYEPDDISVHISHWCGETASRRKAIMISEFLADQEQKHFKMAATNWSIDGLCCLMSQLESNSDIYDLDFSLPESMLQHETVRTGYTQMIRCLSDLETVSLDVSFWKLSPDNERNHGILDAFTDALPNDHVREVCLSTSRKEIMAVADPQYYGLLRGSPSLERLFNSIVSVALSQIRMHGDAVEMLVEATVAEASVLEEVLICDCEILLPERWSRIPTDQGISPRQLRTHLDIRDLSTWSLDCLGGAFDRYDSNLGNFTYSGSPSAGLSPLISRSTNVTLDLEDMQDRRHIECVTQGIRATQSLKTLCINNSLPSLPKEESRRVFHCFTVAISKGRIINLTCPVSFIRHRHTPFDGWERLEHLDLQAKSGIFDGGSELSSNELGQLGFDLVGLMQRSMSFASLTTDFYLDRGHASILRHMVVCKFAGLSEVCDVDASIETVIRVATRAPEVDSSLVYKIHANENEEIGYWTAVVSATFDIIRESAGIIANWCKTTHPRWRPDEANALEDAGSRASKKRRRHCTSCCTSQPGGR